MAVLVKIILIRVLVRAAAAAASRAWRGGSGVLPTDSPPEEQAATRISAAVERPAAAARCRSGRHHRGGAESCPLRIDVIRSSLSRESVDGISNRNKKLTQLVFR